MVAPLQAPVDLDDFLLFRLQAFLVQARETPARRYRRELGLSRRDVRVLAAVAHLPGATIKALAASSGIDEVVLSRCVSDMCHRGLLRKTRLPENRRLTRIEATERGAGLFGHARDIGRQYNRALVAALSDEQVAALNGILEQLRERALRLDTEPPYAPMSPPYPALPPALAKRSR